MQRIIAYCATSWKMGCFLAVVGRYCVPRLHSEATYIFRGDHYS